MANYTNWLATIERMPFDCIITEYVAMGRMDFATTYKYLVFFCDFKTLSWLKYVCSGSQQHKKVCSFPRGMQLLGLG